MDECTCPLNTQIETKYRGDIKSPLVFCGESPGYDEIKAGVPFVGRSGQLLTGICRENGADLDSALIVNAARCLIDKKELKASAITKVLKACRSNLETAITAAPRKLIVALGEIAFRQLTGIKSKQGAVRGRLFWSDEFQCHILPTWHPAACLYDTAKTPELVGDIRKISSILDSGGQKQSCETHYTEVDSLDFLFTMAAKNRVLTGFDTETQGLDWLSPDSLLLTYQIAWQPGHAVLVRLYEECPTEEADFTIRVVRKEAGKKKEPVEVGVRKSKNFSRKLAHLIRYWQDPNIGKVMFNGNFDHHFVDETALRNGLPLPILRSYLMDVQAAAHLIDEIKWTSASLEKLQFEFTNRTDAYSSEFDHKWNKADMIAVPNDNLLFYSCSDADITLQIALAFIQIFDGPHFEKRKRYLYNFLQPVTAKVLYTMEANGASLDLKALPETTKATKIAMDNTHRDAIAMIPMDVRIKHEGKLSLTRPELLRDALFTKSGFHIRPGKRTASRAASVDKEARLDLLSKRSIPARARSLIELYDSWKELHTLYTRYLVGFDMHVRSDGRIHSRHSLCRARTGRDATSDPNTQNFPKHSKEAKIIRKLINAAQGYVLLALDEGQSELRWAAEVADEQTMKQVFADGRDLHTEVALAALGKAESECSEDELKKARHSAKSSNFGLLYLMTAIGFVKYAWTKFGIELTEEEAQDAINKHFKMFPGLNRYHRRVCAFVKAHGYVESVFGRRRHFPEFLSGDIFKMNQAEKQAVNHPIQEPSSSTVLLAALDLIEAGYGNTDECRLVNFVHDELVFEVRDDPKVIAKYYQIIKRAMENPPFHKLGYQMSVPLVSDGKVGYNLAEMQPYEEWEKEHVSEL